MFCKIFKMKHYEFFKDVFPDYSKETTFLLGNGINNYCKTSSSWKNLLIELAKEHIGKVSDYSAILDESSVSYTEFFDIIQLNSDIKNPTFNYKDIKKGFKEGFSKWKPQAIHFEWIESIKTLNRPILTTNYDFLLELSDNKIVDFVKSSQYNKKYFRPKRTVLGRKGFTPYYPWHNYYSNRVIKDAKNEFAIWHIHGFTEYYSSIRLGLADYMGIVTKAKTWLHRASGNPFYQREKIDKWVGKNSWIDIFMHTNLMFIGIDLGVQETSLRWLLIEREKLYRKHPELRKKAWYVLNKSHDKKLLGKALFFEKLNVEIIEANDYKQIYEVTPKRIKSAH